MSYLNGEPEIAGEVIIIESQSYPILKDLNLIIGASPECQGIMQMYHRAEGQKVEGAVADKFYFAVLATHPAGLEVDWITVAPQHQNAFKKHINDSHHKCCLVGSLAPYEYIEIYYADKGLHLYHASRTSNEATLLPNLPKALAHIPFTKNLKVNFGQIVSAVLEGEYVGDVRGMNKEARYKDSLTAKDLEACGNSDASLRTRYLQSLGHLSSTNGTFQSPSAPPTQAGSVYGGSTFSDTSSTGSHSVHQHTIDERARHDIGQELTSVNQTATYIVDLLNSHPPLSDGRPVTATVDWSASLRAQSNSIDDYYDDAASSTSSIDTLMPTQPQTPRFDGTTLPISGTRFDEQRSSGFGGMGGGGVSGFSSGTAPRPRDGMFTSSGSVYTYKHGQSGNQFKQNSATGNTAQATPTETAGLFEKLSAGGANDEVFDGEADGDE